MVHRIERSISDPYPEVNWIFIEVEALGAARQEGTAHTVPLQACEARDAGKDCRRRLNPAPPGNTMLEARTHDHHPGDASVPH